MRRNKYREFLVELPINWMNYATKPFLSLGKNHFISGHLQSTITSDHKQTSRFKLYSWFPWSSEFEIQVSYRSSLTEHSPWNTHTENMSRTSLAFFMGDIWHRRGLTEATWRLVSFLIPGDRRNNRTGPCRPNIMEYMTRNDFSNVDFSYLNWKNIPEDFWQVLMSEKF